MLTFAIIMEKCCV